MFYQNKHWVESEQYNRLIDKCNRLEENLRELRVLYLLCLNLSGHKDVIENGAFDLAEKYGLLGALRLQHTTGTLQNGKAAS
jgi:hypothetical protein